MAGIRTTRQLFGKARRKRGHATVTIAVIGASGTAGTRVVARLRGRDVTVIEIARGYGVDLISGYGLAEALEGADVAIDVSNPMPTDDRLDITETITTASRNLVGACAAQGVQRLVVMTIAGIEDSAFDQSPYFAAKRAVKEIMLTSPVPATVVSSTQWHEFATNPAAVTTNDHEVLVEDWLVQPVAADTVADVLVETALGQTRAPLTITGPQQIRLPDLTAKLLAHQGDDRRVRAVEPALAALAAGGLSAPDHAIILGPDVDAWLLSQPAENGATGGAVDPTTTEIT